MNLQILLAYVTVHLMYSTMWSYRLFEHCVLSSTNHLRVGLPPPVTLLFAPYTYPCTTDKRVHLTRRLACTHSTLFRYETLVGPDINRDHPRCWLAVVATVDQ
jgi:hypothetical protein